MINLFKKIKDWFHYKRQKYLFEKYVLPCITPENLEKCSFEQMARIRTTLDPNGFDYGIFDIMPNFGDYYVNLLSIKRDSLILIFYRKSRFGTVHDLSTVEFMRKHYTPDEQKILNFFEREKEARASARAEMAKTMENMGFKSSNDMPDISSTNDVEDLTQRVDEIKKTYQRADKYEPPTEE